MSETESHRRAKTRAAGVGGQIEVPLPGNRFLDALTPSGRATEVERSGDAQKLKQAVRRLKVAPAAQHVLQVPQNHMPAAIHAMRQVGINGTVKNMGGTKRIAVRGNRGRP